MPEISIIIPVYNSERHLRQCLDSVINQTFSDFELIIVDDGSIDSSPLICDEYAERDNRIKLIHQKNQGVVRARQNGVKKSVCRFLCFVDADDCIDSGILSKMYAAAKENNCDIVSCDVLLEGKAKRELLTQKLNEGFYNKSMLKKYIYPVMLYDKKHRMFGIIPTAWNKLFKREFIERYIYGIDSCITIGEDVALCFPVFLSINRYYYLKLPLYHYKLNFGSMTKRYDVRFPERVEALYSLLEEELGKHTQYGFDEQINCYKAYLTAQWIRLVTENDKYDSKMKIAVIREHRKKYEKTWNGIQTVKYRYLAHNIWPWIFLCRHDLEPLCLLLSAAARFLRIFKRK